MLDNLKIYIKHFIFVFVIFSLALPATITISGLFSDTVYAQKKKERRKPPKAKRTQTMSKKVGAEFTITPSGAVTNPIVVDAEPPGIFNRSALRTIVKWKYKPRILDGKAVPRPGVQHLITYELEDAR